jgi:small nuclear ribonucleoprotein (snRNP)-like protein
MKTKKTKESENQVKSEEIINKIVQDSHLSNFINVVLHDSDKGTLSYVDFIYNNEVNPTELTLKTLSKIIELKDNYISVKIPKDNIKEVNEKFDVSIESMITSALINEAAIQINKEFFTHIESLSTKNMLNAYNTKDKVLSFFYTLINKTYIKKYKIKDVYDLHSIIMKHNNFIAHKSRFGNANYIICSNKTASIISESKAFIFNSEVTGTITASSGMSYIGKLGGLDVYVNLYMKFNDNTIYLGRQQEDARSGLYLVFDKNSAVIEKVETSDKDAQMLNLKLKYSFVLVGNHPENQYTKFTYKPSKKLL